MQLTGDILLQRHNGLLIDLGVENDVVNKSGAWFSYGDVRLGQGRENAKQFLTDNPDLFAKIEKAIRGRTGEVSEALMTGGADDEA